jgi:hypothetical protein
MSTSAVLQVAHVFRVQGLGSVLSRLSLCNSLCSAQELHPTNTVAHCPQITHIWRVVQLAQTAESRQSVICWFECFEPVMPHVTVACSQSSDDCGTKTADEELSQQQSSSRAAAEQQIDNCQEALSHQLPLPPHAAPHAPRSTASSSSTGETAGGSPGAAPPPSRHVDSLSSTV